MQIHHSAALGNPGICPRSIDSVKHLIGYFKNSSLMELEKNYPSLALITEDTGLFFSLFFLILVPPIRRPPFSARASAVARWPPCRHRPALRFRLTSPPRPPR
jgi:hypothetical protein